MNVPPLFWVMFNRFLPIFSKTPSISLQFQEIIELLEYFNNKVLILSVQYSYPDG